jgi:hypothetical protein
MSRQAMDPRLDPARIDPTRGLERDGDEWTLFGLSLEPDACVASDEATREAVDRLWVGPAKWSREDPGILHGRIVGARAEVRALAERGVPVRGVAWADLGGSTGHHSVALALEGARRVLMVDEVDPGRTARGVLAATGVEVVVGDAYETPLDGIEAVLALYSIDTHAVQLTRRRAGGRAADGCTGTARPSPLHGTPGLVELTGAHGRRLLPARGAARSDDAGVGAERDGPPTWAARILGSHRTRPRLAQFNGKDIE